MEGSISNNAALLGNPNFGNYSTLEIILQLWSKDHEWWCKFNPFHTTGFFKERLVVWNRLIGNRHRDTLREKCPYLEFFWSVFFPHSDWIRRDTPYLSLFSLNAGKSGPEQLRIRTFSMQCLPTYFSFYWSY